MTMRNLLVTVLFLSACQPGAYLRRTADCPAGYVPVDTAGGEFSGRAISASGVVVAIRERRNPEEASLDFWTTVLRKELTEGRGYAVRSSKEITGGRAILFSAPQEKTTAYYLAIFVTPAKIRTVEVAGPEQEVTNDLPRLEEFIEKLRLSGA